MKQKYGSIRQGAAVLPGANKTENGYNFAVDAPENAEVSLLLYKKRGRITEVPFPKEYTVGRIHNLRIEDFDPEEYEYNFKIDGEVVQDPWAYGIRGREHFGSHADSSKEIRCRFLSEKEYDWEKDQSPDIGYEDMILYKVHVRGYTRQMRGLVAKRGTFAGLTEMIPYWKELGINTVELMPAYEFCEVPLNPPRQKEHIRSIHREDRVNYWGYTSGFYFSPKVSYCAGGEPEQEFRDMIREFHRNGISCIMEFYFPETVSGIMALRVLQFWKTFYHVDGFHVLGDGANSGILMEDGILSGTKLIFQNFDFDRFYRGKLPEKRCGAVTNMNFLQDMRRFLKSDEGMVEAAAWHIRYSSDNHGVINYMVCQDGFTMNDLVCYNYRHNEANGEDNQDGTSFNYSWNCGVEGPTRKQAVRQMRERQVKNGFLMMLLSRGVPMIYGGDEIGNSQEGNNNAYCQDNPVGWIDWKGLTRNEKLLEFVKGAIAFRREHPILRTPQELKGVDYLSKGFPDVSLHGERAWYCSFENTSRLLGIMYYGAYAEKEDGTPDDFIYVAYNFHWENRNVALPNLPDGMCWKKVADTSAREGGFLTEDQTEYRKSAEISPRTIVVLMGRQEEKKHASVATLQDHHKA